MHNGALSLAQQQQAALINCGPRSVHTGLTSAHRWGLSGWPTHSIHVLVPDGIPTPRVPGLAIWVHRTRRPIELEVNVSRRLHRIAPSLVLATGLMTNPRKACGLLAAAVQQRLTTATDLDRALTAARRTRHRPLLRAIVGDIGMGAQALSEIDFGRLCQLYQLPPPVRQAVRHDPRGRRRYLDAAWRLPDGRLIGAEIDGALHLEQRQWWSDQLRQNELMLGGVPMLRFPSALIRTEPALVADQLRRALALV